MASVKEYEARVYAEVMGEVWASDPIYERFRYRNFVSRSKGKGRKRRHWEGVELVSDVAKGRDRWFSFHKFPFDDAATEVCGYVDNPTEYLKLRVRAG